MTERELLLRAVCESPDDDTPRLAFADWLDEHGEPERAEFIRVQIELQHCPHGKRRLHLTRREHDLISRYEDEWIEPIRPYLLEWSDRPWGMRRGFVERMELEAETFATRGEELMNLTPLGDAVFPDDENFEALANSPHLRRLRSLDFTGSGLTTGFRGVHELLASPHLCSIETLVLQGMDDNAHLDPTGVETLANNPHLGRLRHLDLSNNWFGVDGVAPLLGARWLLQLDRLELEGVGISDEGVEFIASETGFRALRVLNLVANSIGERGAQHILQSAWLGRLEELDLRDNMGEGHIDDPITQQTAEALRHRFGDRIRL